MNYRSIADMARLVRENCHEVPSTVDLIVGIPRSGMLSATMLALTLNLKVTDLQSYAANVQLGHGSTRAARHPELLLPSQARHILLVDDSVSSGRSLEQALAVLDLLQAQRQVTTCAIFATNKSRTLVDLCFEVLEHPRAFEWNLMHRELLASCCVDIDGVLCPDPQEDQNDDGAAYLEFIKSTSPSLALANPIGHLVTSRLERYRTETEAWLLSSEIPYQNLHMLDAPDAETRRRKHMHAPFKAAVYAGLEDSVLFIESDPTQSRDIARLSGKPVLCYTTQELITPPLSLPRIHRDARTSILRVGRRAMQGIRRLLGK